MKTIIYPRSHHSQEIFVILCLISCILISCSSATEMPTGTLIPSFTDTLIPPTRTRTPTLTYTQTLTPTLTTTATPSPTLTSTSTITLTPTATNVGGGSGKLIFLKVDDKTGNWKGSVYSVNFDGTNLTQIPLESKVIAGQLRLSPNGRELLFSTEKGVFVAKSDGSNERLLLDNKNFEGFLTSVGFYPDGKSVLVAKLSFYESQLTRVDIETLKMTILTTGPKMHFELSPDGDKIVYANWESEIHPVTILNLDGSDEIVLQDQDAGNLMQNFAWSPDSTKFLYKSNQDYSNKLIGADGTDLGIIAKATSFVYWLDNDSILILRGSSKYADSVSRYSISSGNEATLVSHDNMFWHFLSISPDSKKISFLGNCDARFKCDIFVTDIDGSNLVNITNSPEIYGDVFWVP